MKKKFSDFVKEDGEGGGVPANNAGAGNIAGIGVGPKGEPGVDLKKKRKQFGEDGVTVTTEATEAEIEAAAKAVHDQWMDKQKELGHTEHKSPDGEEDYMVPYHKLSDEAKDLDRSAVKAVLAVVEETDKLKVGYTWKDKKGRTWEIIERLPFGMFRVRTTDKSRVGELSGKDILAEEHETFAGARVFEVDMDSVMKSRFGKNRYHRYSKYVGTHENAEAIRQHGRDRKSGDIVLKDSTTQVMTYLRRKPIK